LVGGRGVEDGSLLLDYRLRRLCPGKPEGPCGCIGDRDKAEGARTIA
jgi:hypothetical protein